MARTTGGPRVLAGADGCAHLRGVHLDMLVLDAPALQPPTVWPELLRPTRGARRGGCVRSGTVVDKHNHCYPTCEAAASGLLAPADLASNRATRSEAQSARAFALAPMGRTEASLYGTLLAQAREDGRLGHVGHTPGADVQTGVECGGRDATAVGAGPRVGVASPVLHVFPASRLPVADSAAVLTAWRRAPGYSSGTHYAPHAAASATSPTGPRMAATAMASGLSFEIGERGRLAAGISVPRHLLPPCWGDEATCAAGLAARERYPSDWNPDRPVFSLHPAHSRSSHAADALRTFAVGYQDEVDLAQYTPPPPSILRFNPFTYGR